MLTVVIPTLNAAATLRAVLDATAWPATIVVDGGSADDTLRIAGECRARILVAPRGRGSQLAAGAAAADTDWVLLLHADTRPAPGWLAAVANHLDRHPGRAGYFRFTLDSPDPRARRLERWVAWRCRTFALPYGDQGLLVSRGLLSEIGGIRPLPLMEDVDLVRRLGRARLAPLNHSATTSAAKWERGGWLRRSAKNLLCLALYRGGVPVGLIQRVYR